MEINLKGKAWWDYLEKDLQELLEEAVLLANRVESWQEKFHDYAFIVFPAAKAYEGFLKHLFLDLGLISNEDYYGKRFRVGKALNPALEKDLREREGVYDKLVDLSKGKELPDKLWQTWKKCRNLLFHWFPRKKNAITLAQAKERLLLIIESIDEASALTLNE